MTNKKQKQAKEQQKLIPAIKDYAASFDQLRDEAGDGLPPNQPVGTPRVIPLKSLRFASGVFQPRTFMGDRLDSSLHIKALMDAARNTPGWLLDPITVWWSGAHWYVLDGHHRVAAYRELGRHPRSRIIIRDVNVTVFTGSLVDAVEETAVLNSRNKLPMSKSDKIERAWKVITLDPLQRKSRRRIAGSCGVSERTVSNMRGKLAEVAQEGAMGIKEAAELMRPMSWAEAQAYGKPEQEAREVDDEWVKAQAQSFAKRLARQFRGQLLKQPTAAAMALHYYSKQLPPLLAAEFALLGYAEPIDELEEALNEELKALDELP